jgi:hypothetical protein
MPAVTGADRMRCSLQDREQEQSHMAAVQERIDRLGGPT